MKTETKKHLENQLNEIKGYIRHCENEIQNCDRKLETWQSEKNSNIKRKAEWEVIKADVEKILAETPQVTVMVSSTDNVEEVKEKITKVFFEFK